MNKIKCQFKHARTGVVFEIEVENECSNVELCYGCQMDIRFEVLRRLDDAIHLENCISRAVHTDALHPYVS